jgi:hypothetical protein
MSAIHSGPRTIENPLIKDKATFLETTADTNGASTLIQVELAPSGGNGLHYHKTFDETFTVLEGSLGVQIGKKISYLSKGRICHRTRRSNAPIFQCFQFGKGRVQRAAPTRQQRFRTNAPGGVWLGQGRTHHRHQYAQEPLSLRAHRPLE